MVTKQGCFMPITNLIIEAKKTIPYTYPTAHAWLQDMLTTQHQLPDPTSAIRFFMLGLYACELITLDEWDAFDSLVTEKKSTSIH